MSSGSFANRIRREIKASPQKAAILAVLGVVALYFWAPLVMKWTSGDKPLQATAQSTTEAVSTASATEAALPTEKPVATQHSWRELDAWMSQDVHMKPATTALATRDPFRSSNSPEAAAVWTRNLVASGFQTLLGAPSRLLPRAWRHSNGPAVEPGDAGLVVSSTIVGSRRRVALISGKAYAEGNLVRGEGEFAELAFELVRVRPKSVLLRRGGTTYELKVNSLDLAQHGTAPDDVPAGPGVRGG